MGSYGRTRGLAEEWGYERVQLRVDFFEPQPKPRTQQVTFRAPKDLKSSIEKLAKFWTALEIVRTGDPLAKVSESDVWVRLGEVASAAAWAPIGGEPKTAEELETLMLESSERLKKKLADAEKTKP
jgi:hypothetical protein